MRLGLYLRTMSLPLPARIRLSAQVMRIFMSGRFWNPDNALP